MWLLPLLLGFRRLNDQPFLLRISAHAYRPQDHPTLPYTCSLSHGTHIWSRDPPLTLPSEQYLSLTFNVANNIPALSYVLYLFISVNAHITYEVGKSGRPYPWVFILKLIPSALLSQNTIGTFHLSLVFITNTEIKRLRLYLSLSPWDLRQVSNISGMYSLTSRFLVAQKSVTRNNSRIRNCI